MEIKLQNFQVLDCENPEHRKLIETELLVNDVSSDEPAKRLLYLFCDQPTQPSKTVIIENLFLDTDYIDSYVTYFLKSYRSCDKWCKRIHFFGTRFKEVDLVNLSPAHIESYLGFVVVRPISHYRVGRTIIKQTLRGLDEHFILSKCKYPVNLAGNHIDIEGTIFMQQDTQISVCATAALWMAQANLSQHTRVPCYTTSQIGEMATGRGNSLVQLNLSEGLDLEQMERIIRRIGYNPVIYKPMQMKEQLHNIYRYIESGIPVMVSIKYPRKRKGIQVMQQHSLAIMGHAFTTNTNPKRITRSVEDFQRNIQSGEADKRSLTYCRSSEWVPYFIAHDDTWGPYKRFQLLQDDQAIEEIAKKSNPEIIGSISDSFISTPFTWAKFSNEHTDNIDEDPFYVAIYATLIALPKEVSLRAEKAEQIARWLLVSIDRILKDTTAKDEYIKKLNIDDGNLVLRTYLCRSNEFKRRFNREATISTEIKARYHDLSMPKYIWVTEITNIEYMNKPNAEERMSLGEIVIDSAANPNGEEFIAIRVCDYFIDMKPNETDAVESIVTKGIKKMQGEYRIPHLVRKP